MPCPYFVPLQSLGSRRDRAYWPLLAPWSGECAAESGFAGSAVPVTDADAVRWCNFGYAAGCPRLPAGRPADKISFGIARERDGILQLTWVLERDHLPVAVGSLHYEREQGEWRSRHEDPILQRQAECYIAAAFGEVERPAAPEPLTVPGAVQGGAQAEVQGGANLAVGITPAGATEGGTP
jgi:hypothetical protein